VRLTETMWRVLKDLRDGRDPGARVSGRSQAGGFWGTINGLQRRGLVTLDPFRLTPKGEELVRRKC